MKKILIFAIGICCLNDVIAQAPAIIQKDPEIEQMLREISPDSLQSYIKTMVAFGTRNTLSTQKDSKRG